MVQLVAEVACGLSAGQAAALAGDLEAMTSPRPLTRVAGLAAPRSVVQLAEAWAQDGAMTGPELALAIRCAASAVKTTSSYEKVELIYTGPGAPDIRRSSQALLEVVRGARARLWVVSYALVGVDEVLSAMEERARAEVDVNVVVDHRVGFDATAQDKTWAAVTERLATHAPSCRVLVWPDDERSLESGKKASLHAKCAVADGRQAFVSSANLTDAAMERNLEVGYLVTGGTSPRVLDGYLRRLMATSILVTA